MIDFKFENECYSCMLCKYECPKNAIYFSENLQPIINHERCINCNICENVCIALNNSSVVTADMQRWKGYVAKNINEDIRQKSSSGGLFYQLAKSVIDNNGYVCGCIFDDKFMPKHIVTDSIEDIKKMMGSKYVKSDLDNCISRIKRLIKEGKRVLFSGVPCQIAAIKKVIKSENLITIAVVCHGSIERDVWKQYLEEESEKGPIIGLSMRDKSHGWLNYGMKISYEDGTEQITYRKENGYFLKCFTEGLFERDRCLNCEYKGNNIISDILLGDAWGMDKFCPKLIDKNGASVVIVCTTNGRKIFQDIKKNIKYKEISVQTIIDNNQRIMTVAPENPLRNRFTREIKKKDSNVHKICQKYGKNTLLNRFKRKIAKLI